MIDTEAIAALRALDANATRAPWIYYRPSELPRDWRIARAGRAGDLGPGTRDYVGRFTTSHDPKRSGNGGRALEGPLEADIAVMVEARNALPSMLDRLETLERERRDLFDAGKILRCAFCDAEYPPGTPPTQHEALTAHVKVCTKHPLRELLENERRESQRLRDVLERIEGGDAPCRDESSIRQWAYEARVLGRTVEQLSPTGGAA